MRFSIIHSPFAFLSSSVIFIGRTEYTVSMFKEDSFEKHWNVTFSDYSVHASKRDSLDYKFVHLASTSNGELATVDRFTGNVLWERNFGSPVVATYVMETSSLVRVPLMSLGVDTMHNLLDTLSTPGIPAAFFQKVRGSLNQF